MKTWIGLTRLPDLVKLFDRSVICVILMVVLKGNDPAMSPWGRDLSSGRNTDESLLN